MNFCKWYKFADDTFLTTTTVKVLNNAYDEQRLFRLSFPGLNAVELLAQHQFHLQEFERQYGAVQAIFADLLSIAQMVDEYTTRQKSNFGHGFFQFAGGLAQAQVANMMMDGGITKEEEFDTDDDDDDEDELDLDRIEYDEDEVSPFIRAILADDIAEIENFLADGADLNPTAWNEAVPLVAAVYRGNQAIVEKLIAAGAELNKLDFYVNARPIGMAIKQNRPDLVQLLLDELLAQGADPSAIGSSGKSPLMLAAMYGHKEAIEVLLDAGADPNSGSDEEFKEGTTALMQIASSFFAQNRAEVIKLLVARGADVNLKNDRGQTALMLGESNVDAVKALIEAGADVNPRDKNGNTALMLGTWAVQQLLRQAGASEVGLNDVALVKAADTGDLAKVEELLQAGANVNYLDGSALVAAAGTGNLALVDRLIEAGADVNLGKTGFTPIAKAAYEGYLNIVERLLTAGADPFQRTHDDEFYDALDYARQGQAQGHHQGKDHAAIIERLEQLGNRK